MHVEIVRVAATSALTCDPAILNALIFRWAVFQRLRASAASSEVIFCFASSREYLAGSGPSSAPVVFGMHAAAQSVRAAVPR